MNTVALIVVLLIYSVATSLIILRQSSQLTAQRDGARRLVQLESTERHESAVHGLRRSK